MLYLVATAAIYVRENKNFLILFVQKGFHSFPLIIFKSDSGELQIETNVTALYYDRELLFQSIFSTRLIF